MEIRKGLISFSGVKRRFDIRLNYPGLVYIDDYAHHPEEIKACITSVREYFRGRKITGIFQPHLFSRTRDNAEGFAKILDTLDEAILLPIYPAREKPIEGVSSAKPPRRGQRWRWPPLFWPKFHVVTASDPSNPRS